MISVRLATSHDIEFVNRVLREPSIYNAMVDDTVKGLDFDTAQIMGEAIFMIPSWNEKDIGILIFHPLNGTCYEVHIGVLPEFRGRITIVGAAESIKWIFTHTACSKIIAHVPDNNMKTYALGRRLGFKRIGTNSKSLLVDGTLHDQDIYGCEKEEFRWEA